MRVRTLHDFSRGRGDAVIVQSRQVPDGTATRAELQSLIEFSRVDVRDRAVEAAAENAFTQTCIAVRDLRRGDHVFSNIAERVSQVNARSCRRRKRALPWS